MWELTGVGLVVSCESCCAGRIPLILVLREVVQVIVRFWSLKDGGRGLTVGNV